jgi:hypothetical protein
LEVSQYTLTACFAALAYIAIESMLLTTGVKAAIGMNITLAPRKTFVNAFVRIAEVDSG